MRASLYHGHTIADAAYALHTTLGRNADAAALGSSAGADAAGSTAVLVLEWLHDDDGDGADKMTMMMMMIMIVMMMVMMVVMMMIMRAGVAGASEVSEQDAARRCAPGHREANPDANVAMRTGPQATWVRCGRGEGCAACCATRRDNG
eukprot:4053302-Pleurochrysis_carterae.AAC.4